MFLLHSDTSLHRKIEAQPMIKDGASRLFFFNAGTDATKDPSKRMSTYRMKASCDEDHLREMIDISSRLMGESDSGIIISGRNQLMHRDAKKFIAALKPKIPTRDLAMEPDEEQLLRFIRADTNVVGTVDARDQYIQFGKSLQKRKGEPRRFVPGNTAFKIMGHLPVLDKSCMVQIPYDERETVFRSVQGSDRWQPGKKGAGGKAYPDDEDIESEEEEGAVDDAQDAVAVVDGSAPVVFFWMELHPRAPRAQNSSFEPTHACTSNQTNASKDRQRHRYEPD